VRKKYLVLVLILLVLASSCSLNVTASDNNVPSANKTAIPESVIVVMSHGSMPLDYPTDHFAQLMSIEFRIKNATGDLYNSLAAREKTLDDEIRNWPRTAANDPFKAQQDKLAAMLETKTGMKVISGYNDFCAPSSIEALHQAIETGAKTIIVLTTMLTAGGYHVEVAIPKEIDELRKQYPDRKIIYAWPFTNETIINLLSDQVKKSMISK